MPTCETATEVGQTYRYVWQEDGSGRSFGSTGELLEVAAPYRVVTTERMYGDGIPDDAPGTVHELTLTHVEGGTLLAIVITYPDAATRDAVVGTGMVGGRETRYARLEHILLTG